MVVIVNGEVVPDNDPRAARLRQQPSSSADGRPSSSSASASSSPSSTAPSSSLFHNNFLTGDVSRVLGIQGRTIRIPAVSFLHKRSFDLPLIYAIVLALVVFLAGIQALVIVGLVYILVAPSQTPNNNNAARQQQQTRF
eukprot:GHVS01064110.1.p1 GENE.GHVS01064110.1~~GHVS01064110.1.p1  ORF type:complete len:139 (+),score=44.14 GHVS01064110.1:64-480(+)